MEKWLQNFSLRSLFYPFLKKDFSKCPNSKKPLLPWKDSGCTSVLGTEWHWYRFEYAAIRGVIHCYDLPSLKSDTDFVYHGKEISWELMEAGWFYVKWTERYTWRRSWSRKNNVQLVLFLAWIHLERNACKSP